MKIRIIESNESEIVVPEVYWNAPDCKDIMDAKEWFENHNFSGNLKKRTYTSMWFKLTSPNGNTREVRIPREWKSKKHLFNYLETLLDNGIFDR